MVTTYEDALHAWSEADVLVDDTFTSIPRESTHAAQHLDLTVMPSKHKSLVEDVQQTVNCHGGQGNLWGTARSQSRVEAGWPCAAPAPTLRRGYSQ